MSLSRRKFSA